MEPARCFGGYLSISSGPKTLKINNCLYKSILEWPKKVSTPDPQPCPKIRNVDQDPKTFVTATIRIRLKPFRTEA